MTDREAREAGLGGEFVCQIWEGGACRESVGSR
jgi:hypothetical protein